MIKLENISFDHCIKCTVCTVYCPVARVTHLYPGPKQSGPDTERLRIKNPQLLDISLKYCSNCKRCEIACPSDVKIADIIQTAKWKYSKKELRIRDFLLSRTDLMGFFGTLFSPIVNFFTHLGIVKYFLDIVFKIPRGRSFPAYASTTFERWFKKVKKSQESYEEKVVYFHGCYVNYNYPQLGKEVVKVLNALNKGVIISKEKCCGVPLIANGYIKLARIHGRHNVKVLHKAMPHDSTAIVSASSSCTLAIKHEYPNLLEIDNSAVANNIEYITQYVLKEFAKENIPTLQPLRYTVAYHSPCHLERMGSAAFTIELLRRIPQLTIKILHSECCGISGTYGFKNEYYDISQAVGGELFRIIDEAQPDFVVSDCETCKWQIEMNTKYKVVHPISLLAESLG